MLNEYLLSTQRSKLDSVIKRALLISFLLHIYAYFTLLVLILHLNALKSTSFFSYFYIKESVAYFKIQMKAE